MSQSMTYQELQDWICGSMQQKGFHDDWTGTAEDAEFRIALINTEIGESINEVKRHWTDNPTDEVRKDLAWELADVAIRGFDLLGLCEFNELSGECLDMYTSIDPMLGRKELAIIINDIFYTSVAAAYSCYSAGRLEYWYNVVAREDFFGELVGIIKQCDKVCYGIRYPLLQAIREKMEKNMSRPHKYGTPDATTSAQ